MKKFDLKKAKAFALHNKAYIALAAAIVLAGGFLFAGGNGRKVSIITPTFGELVSTVQATGEVVSKTDLDLSFNKQGTVRAVKVSVGDKVGPGAILATLDQGSLLGALTSAKGKLAAAEAKYQKILDGASSAEITLAEVALQNAINDYEKAKNEQDLLVANAKRAFEGSGSSEKYDSYELAIKVRDSTLGSAQSLVSQREAELLVKKSAARQSEIDLAKADILSAQGDLQTAEANYEDTIIRAPARGTITRVDIKYGEQALANEAVITIEDVENLYVEADINESDIANLKINQAAEVTLDAFGSEKKFKGVVYHVDPSAVTLDGIVNYRVKIFLEESDSNIRPGMNAEVTILASRKLEALSIPMAAIIKKDGKSYVNLVTNEKKGRYDEQEVVLGAVGDGNMVEVLEGLSQSDKVAQVSQE